MTATWSVIKPQAATNYVINPSFELGASTPTGWTITGGAIVVYCAQDPVYTWRGAYSSRCATSSGYGGLVQDISLTNTQTYTCQIRIHVEYGSVQLWVTDYGGTNNAVATATGWTAGWYLLTVTKVAANGGLRLNVVSANVSAGWSMDCAMVEDGAVATTYIDGREPGCYWSGAADLSTSVRDGQSRDGGLPVALNPAYFKDFTSITGSGVMPVNVASLPMGLAGGEIFQRTTNAARRMIFTGPILGNTLDALHTKRRGLYDLVKHDLVTPEQPVKMLYNDGVSAQTLEIKAVYEDGLGGNFDLASFRSGVELSAQLRMVAHDPLFYSQQNMSQILGYSQTVTNANYILQRINGVWSPMNTGVSAGAVILAIAYNPVDGCIYAGGGFTQMDSVANTAHIAKWTPGAAGAGVWSALGTGTSTGTVNAIAIDAAGNVYIGGTFATANGVTVNNIAMWNGSTFVALGATPGTNGTVSALAFGPDGSLYASGGTTFGGTTCNHVAKWNGSAWSALGGGANNQVSALRVDASGKLYAGGNFTLMGGIAGTARIAVWNGTAWLPLSTGANDVIYALTFGLDGILYAGGLFTAIGGITTNFIAKWNGTAWSALGSGITGTNIQALATHPKTGAIYIGGLFTAAGGNAMPDSVTMWTGTSFLPLDVKLGLSHAGVFAFDFDKFGNLFIGYNTDGSATSATVTVSSNSSTKAYPLAVYMGGVTAATTIYQLVNYTTGRAIYFNNLQIQVGEVILLFLTPGAIRMASTWRGDMNNYILKGSNLDWYIQPGNNNISCYGVGGAPLIYMVWKNAYASSDGVA
jgi:hypothetical protein